MIDTWFKKDLERIFEKHNIAVFIDESGDSKFLLDCTDGKQTVHAAHNEIEELHVKYLIESGQPSSDKHVIYTNLAKDKLKFVREYCETNGCLEIRYIQHYIKEKVHQTLNLNINLAKDELIAAAKVSIGKDKTYWMDLIHKGVIFDLEKELIPFLHDPKAYSENNYDDQLRETFYRKVNDLLNQEYIDKPAETLAAEVVNAIFDGLVSGQPNKTLEQVYCSWLDSVTYKSSLSGYIYKYKVSTDTDIWQVSTSHPFQEIDDQWMKEIGDSLSVNEPQPEYLGKIKQRSQNAQANSIGISFWKDISVLLEFDVKQIAQLSSLKDCIKFYTNHFYTLDTAIRNLYTEFLNRKSLLEPIQDYYKNLATVFLDKWFKYFDKYKQNQTGTLQRIIDENASKTAIIVCDGVGYEIAQSIAQKVSGKFKVKMDYILADSPSETENNMSQIYMADGAVEKVQSKREKFLEYQNPDKAIGFVKLDDVSEETIQHQYLICTHKDIDDIGEKLQHKALKYFPESVEFFAEKIELLLRNGYKKVYLISDHGFVLSGILNEADKVEVDFSGTTHKLERYVRSVEKQKNLSESLIGFKKTYEDFKYVYFSTTLNPFKTPGSYGFSHGGISPQELITPYFCWESDDYGASSLDIQISNKTDLTNVTGELFQIKLQAATGTDDFFSMERKVYLVFFSKEELVLKSDIMTIGKNEKISKEYPFEGRTEMEVQLLDAETKEQLDKAKIKQNKDRDLNGLL
jgi:hypothetical protein